MLSYEPNLDEKTIPTNARPIKIKHELTIHFQEEINDFLEKHFSSPSKSH